MMIRVLATRLVVVTPSCMHHFQHQSLGLCDNSVSDRRAWLCGIRRVDLKLFRSAFHDFRVATSHGLAQEASPFRIHTYLVRLLRTLYKALWQRRYSLAGLAIKWQIDINVVDHRYPWTFLDV